MTSRVHSLKTQPEYFEPVWLGLKTFEVRYDDRGYQAGDDLVLREWERRIPCAAPSCIDHTHQGPRCNRYTGREIVATVGYVLSSTPARGQQPGFQGRGHVVLALVDGYRNDSTGSRLTEPPVPPADGTRPLPSPRAGDNTAVRHDGVVVVTEAQLTGSPSPLDLARAAAANPKYPASR